MPRPKKTDSRERPELSRLETEIMDVVWRLGECSSAEVIDTYSKSAASAPHASTTRASTTGSSTTRRLAPTTIRTVLANLRKKGYLKPVPTIEPGFRLRPTVERDSVVRRTLKSLVAGLLGGSPRQAIAYLLKDENLNDADLEEIRRLVDSQRKGKRP